ncbi:class II aldolase/adducin family protein [Neobacillus niacini]|uniref:class II aldolase/adducin family protein n=1 Tax=Neobacillus niacini TaxID=86668 RepID=UPI0005EDCF5B|nr:class II aldolase/adducin family protein [Neobacillus niacini]
MQDNKQYYSDLEAREMICEIGRRMYNRNYVAANDGNISVKVRPNAIWTTPTGVSKGYMTPDMMVKMDLSGKILSGNLKPSSEVKMHLRVYNENPEVNAVVHAHPPVATSFAIAGICLDKPILPEAIVLLGTVPVAPYALPGTQEVPDSIAPYCKEHNAVLLANHGALTWGRDLVEAYFRMESLEHYATILMHSNHILKKANELNQSQITDLIKIRESMGIKAGGVPICKDESPNSLQAQDIEKIVQKVTEEVLKTLKKF